MKGETLTSKRQSLSPPISYRAEIFSFCVDGWEKKVWWHHRFFSSRPKLLALIASEKKDNFITENIASPSWERFSFLSLWRWEVLRKKSLWNMLRDSRWWFQSTAAARHTQSLAHDSERWKLIQNNKNYYSTSHFNFIMCASCSKCVRLIIFSIQPWSAAGSQAEKTSIGDVFPNFNLRKGEIENDGMYASYASGDLFSFTWFLWHCWGSLRMWSFAAALASTSQ